MRALCIYYELTDIPSSMLLDYLAQHGASDPEIARCLTRPPTLAPTGSGRGGGMNGS